MAEPGTADETVIEARFTADQLAAIDAWIGRHPDPRPDRATAVRELVLGRLGAHAPSTILPGFTTGRDIG